MQVVQAGLELPNNSLVMYFATIGGVPQMITHCVAIGGVPQMITHCVAIGGVLQMITHCVAIGGVPQMITTVSKSPRSLCMWRWMTLLSCMVSSSAYLDTTEDQLQ